MGSLGGYILDGKTRVLFAKRFIDAYDLGSMDKGHSHLSWGIRARELRASRIK